MVKITELAEDGQNWKLYHAKYLKVTATEGLLSIVAGWELDDGTKDWAHRAAVARMLFLMTTSPPLRLNIRLMDSARQIFRYLSFYFRDYEPIVDPCTKKLSTSANEAKRVGAAAEHAKNSGHAHGQSTRRRKSRKWDKEDLSTTKDLT